MDTKKDIRFFDRIAELPRSLVWILTAVSFITIALGFAFLLFGLTNGNHDLPFGMSISPGAHVCSAGVTLLQSGSVGLISSIIALTVSRSAANRRHRLFNRIQRRFRQDMKGLRRARQNHLTDNADIQASSSETRNLYFGLWTTRETRAESSFFIEFTHTRGKKPVVVVSVWQYSDFAHVGVFLHKTLLTPKTLDLVSASAKNFFLPYSLSGERHRGYENLVEIARHDYKLIDHIIRRSELLSDAPSMDYIMEETHHLAINLVILLFSERSIWDPHHKPAAGAP